MKALLFVLRLLFLLAGSGLIWQARAEGVKVIYPAGDIPNDPRFHDVIEMLRTALEKTKPQYGPYELMPNPTIMPKARYILELEQAHNNINVIWNSTSEELETRFLPIRIPLRKGLLGYRIALIARENQSKIDQVKTLDDLKKLTIGQGIGWNDNLLYEAAGIEVVKSKYGQLFKMAGANRFDLFPRGVGEIFPEYEQNLTEVPNLAVEKNLLIIYPFPYYFFFNPKDRALKERVETGLRMMQRDGSFDTIFRKHHQAAIEKANLKGRRIIRLPNPLLPKTVPLDNPGLWYDPTR
ncbi:MAG: hypothetical protein RL748_4455 [Pseudomonadota bacterium]|jgi:ABC-type amino acid transport substrate-binding protein